MELLGSEAEVKWDVVHDHSPTVCYPLQVRLAISPTHLRNFLDEQFLHWIEVGPLSLTRDPLEAIPKELIAIVIELFGYFRLVFIDEVGVRGHAVLLSTASVAAVLMSSVVAVAAISTIAALVFSVSVIGANAQ